MTTEKSEAFVQDNSVQEQEVVLRDLQSLLLESVGKDVQVVECTTTNLLPKGENYASTMLMVEVLIKRTKNSPEEKLSLVAKMIPTSDFQKTFFNSTASYTKEIYILQDLAQIYKQLERDARVNEADVFDLFPKIYGGRLTRNKEKPDVADEDAVMVMENLKAQGYDTMSRFKGLDFDHAKLAITELARFHALGMALRYHKPEIFEKAKEIINVFPFDLKNMDEFKDVGEHMVDTICKDKRTAKYEDKIRDLLLKNNGFETMLNVKVEEPWITISHGDFWVNNIMFRHDKEGNIDDIKFVDFQISRVCSPLIDLPYFLCASTSQYVIDNYFDELLDIYLSKFVKTLNKLGCDSSPFTKKNFDEHLKEVGNSEFFHCIMAIKFFTLEVDPDMDLNDMKDSIMMAKPNNLYLDRAYKIVSKFDEKGWL